MKIQTRTVFNFCSQFTVIGLILFSSSSFAQPVCLLGKPLYPFITLGGGIGIATQVGASRTFINSTTGTTTFSTSSNGLRGAGVFDGFLGVEWLFHPRWAIQVGIGYNQSTSYPVDGAAVQDPSAIGPDSFSYSYNIIVRQYLAEMRLMHNFYSFHPYVAIGAGASQNSAYNFISKLPITYFVNGSSSSFSYNAGFGLDFDVLCHLRMGIGYRYANFGKVKLGNQVSLVTPLSGTLAQSNFYVHQGLIEISFLF